MDSAQGLFVLGSLLASPLQDAYALGVAEQDELGNLEAAVQAVPIL